MGAVATTVQGQVEGHERDGVLRFAGIPYAAPPTGPRRFRAPEPPERWTGVRDGGSFGPVSWQAPGLMGGLLGGGDLHCDEDCLTLNVQTPALDDGARPVMVWIHGGGFTGGSGGAPWYNGSRFVAHGDVVVVSVNYRLGAVGFLHLPEVGGDGYASSGLNGILDQVAALEWVRDNIAAFGGDPANVTVFGESAGGMSIGVLLGLPRAAGLFHQAIPQSGAAHNVLGADRAAIVTARFLEQLGVDDLDGLLAATPEQLVAAQGALPALLTKERLEAGADGLDGGGGVDLGGAIGLGMPFQPVLDGVELPTSPLQAVRDGLSADVALLTGTTAEEWKLFHLMSPGQLDDARLLERLGRLVPDGEVIAETYRANRPGATADDLWCAVLTDVIFRIPAIRLAEAQLPHQPEGTFSYLFSWRSRAFDGRLGSCHALEIPFVFDNVDRGGSELFLGEGPLPTELARAVHDSWWHFARTRAPGHDGIEAWAPYDLEARTTFELGDAIGPRLDPAADERRLWEGIL